MSDKRTIQHESRLDQIIADYLAAEESGHRPDRDKLIASHPELADPLRTFFADHDRLNDMLGDDDEEPPRSPVRVRYFGDYELQEEIARGGMGAVYKARQKSLNRTVAVKVILGGPLADDDDLKRFRTEAEAAGRLQHSRIVSVHEVGIHQGLHYFSMDYVEGRSLAEIAREAPLFPRRAARYVKQIAEAVHFGHQEGILHRDLKPSNVLIDSDDSVRITDFGLARKVQDDSSLTQTGQIVGTPQYMAPEQAEAKHGLVGPASDGFAMGAILYELLTGRPPFRAETTIETLRQVIEQEPVPPRQLNPKVPRDLETICLKCLQKEPHRRYATAQHLAEDLEHFLQGEPIAARPIGKAARLWRWGRRNPLISGLLTTVVMSLVLGTGVASYFAVDAYQQAQQTQRAQQQTERQKQQAIANAAQARRHLYIAHMNLIQNAWNEGRMSKVRHLLDRHRPRPNQVDLQDFEWFYWNRLCPLVQTFKVPTYPVSSVAFSPDGNRLASASYDDTVKLWDVATGLEIRTFKGHRQRISSVAFSPDGTRLASASWDKTIKLWDAATGEEIRTLEGYTNRVNDVAFSPDGTRLASASFDEKVIKLWDAESGEEVRTLEGHTNRVKDVAFSPDGALLASASADNAVKLWNVATGDEIRTFKGHMDTVWDVAFSPDRTRLASASADNTVKLWNVATGEEIRTFKGHTGGAYGVAFSSDGAQIASANGAEMVKIWEVGTSEKEFRTLKRHNEYVMSLTFSPDGSRIASASFDDTVKLWDVATGEEIRTLEGHTGGAYGVAFGPDGTHIASGGSDHTVKLWDADTGEEIRTLKGHIDDVWSVAFSPDGSWLASGGDGLRRNIKLWDATTGEEIRTLEGHTNQVMSVAFSPDGTRLASASEDETVKLWDVATGEEIRTLTGHTNQVMSVAFSPDGTSIASANADGTVRLWDTASGNEIRTLIGHTDYVTSVAFSPDGTRLASASFDETVKLWDVATGEEVLTLRDTDSLCSVAFSPDGTRLASGNSDGTITIWDAPRSKAEPISK